VCPPGFDQQVSGIARPPGRKRQLLVQHGSAGIITGCKPAISLD
jgi:hypothetical protein